VFRVRVGPFSKRDDAEQLKGKLDGAGVDSASWCACSADRQNFLPRPGLTGQ
jgi:cell division protein FtsN